MESKNIKPSNAKFKIFALTMLFIVSLFLIGCDDSTEAGQENIAGEAAETGSDLADSSKTRSRQGHSDDDPDAIMQGYNKNDPNQRSFFRGEGTLITGIIRNQKDEVIVSESDDSINIELYTQADSDVSEESEELEELSDYGPNTGSEWQKTDEFNSLTGVFRFEVDAGEKYYVRVSKSRYLEAYGSNDGQPLILKDGEEKELDIKLIKNPKRVEKYSDNGKYAVSYYEGQENCADRALDLFEDNYLYIKEFLGVEHRVKSPTVKVNTLMEGKWQGSPAGIEIVCAPWLLEESWDEHIQRAIAEHFISSQYGTNVMPKWARKGFGIYVQMTMGGEEMNCDEAPLTRLSDPRYDGYFAGACTFEMLESQSKAFVTRLIKASDKFNSNYIGNTNDGFFIKEIMSNAFGEDLVLFFVDNFGFKADDLKMDHDKISSQVKMCPECDDSDPTTRDICQYSDAGPKCKSMVNLQ